MELRTHIYKKKRETSVNFSNARYIRNIIEQSIRHHAVRLLNQEAFSPDDLIFLTGDDLTLDDQ